MSKRASGTKQGAPQRRPNAAPSKGTLSPVAIGGIVVVVLAVGAALFWPSSSTPNSQDSAEASPPTSGVVANEQQMANAAGKAALGPHKQASYPPIPFQGYTPPRPDEVVTAAYKWAAEHPEIASYVPCFCGCERSGHEGNTDCFVKSRAPNGDVVEWDEHGLDCAVCIDVATRSRQMYSSGASVRDIRTAIDKEFGPLYQGRMPTPHPPAAHATH